MEIISRKVHSFLDYLVGGGLIATSLIFWDKNGGAHLWVPLLLAFATLVVSMLTNYEGGIFKLIPFSAHLTIDILQAVILGLSPWLFGFSNLVYWPFVVVAFGEVLVVILTEKPQK